MNYPIPNLNRLAEFAPAQRFHIYWFDFEVFPEVTILCTLDESGRRRQQVGYESCARWLKSALGDPDTVLVGFNSRNYDNVIAARLLAGATQPQLWLTNEVLVGNVVASEADWLTDVEEVEFLEDVEGSGFGDLEDMVPETTTRMVRSVSPFDLVWKTPGILDVYKRTFDIGLNAWAPRKKGMINIPAVSLKTWEASNGLERVECPISFGTWNLTPEDIASVVEYCHYDVAATACLSCGMAWGELSGRIALVVQYGDRTKGGVHWGHTKAKAAAAILGAGRETDYDDACEAEALPIPWDRLPLVCEKLPSLVQFFSQPCSMLSTSVGAVITIFGLDHQFGVGGAHSIHEHARRIECATDGLWHADAASMYPAIIIGLDLLPMHCTRRGAYQKAMKDRIRKKRCGDPTAAADKILLNAVSGAMDQRGSPLYHHRNAVLCRVYGQLCLAELALGLEGDISELIQSNTDGVYVIPKQHHDDAIGNVCRVVGKRVGLTFEIDKHMGMYQKNVNNYVVWDEPGVASVVKGGAYRNATAANPTGPQRVSLANALGVPVPWDSMTPDDFAITVMRDKNSACFIMNGAELKDERLRVVAVPARIGSELFTRLKSGGARKATRAPDSCVLTNDCKVSDVDVNYYESFSNDA